MAARAAVDRRHHARHVGKELAERIKELQPNLRVLYMSGYNDEIVNRHGALDAAGPLIQKPFDVGSLLASVDRALQTDETNGDVGVPT